MNFPLEAEATCLRSFDVPARKMATVASAIGLPPSSRTYPVITASPVGRFSRGTFGALFTCTAGNTTKPAVIVRATKRFLIVEKNLIQQTQFPTARASDFKALLRF